jgi:hypothetical protein
MIKDLETAKGIISRLHEYAKSLEFGECSKVICWDREKDDPAVGFLFHYLLCYDHTPDASRFLNVAPLDFTMFTVRNPGSETAAFGLGRYESVAPDISDDSIRLPTNLAGYHWSSFCKTQYASLPKNGGWDNFFKIHDGICRVLEQVGSMGVDTLVRDDGEYWQDRDPAALHQKIDHWNRLIAAFTGKLKDAIGDKPGAVVAPITEDPSFERMEAEGQHLFEKD